MEKEYNYCANKSLQHKWSLTGCDKISQVVTNPEQEFVCIYGYLRSTTKNNSGFPIDSYSKY